MGEMRWDWILIFLSYFSFMFWTNVRFKEIEKRLTTIEEKLSSMEIVLIDKRIVPSNFPPIQNEKVKD